MVAAAVVVLSGSTPPAADSAGFWLAALMVPVLVRSSVLVVRRTQGVELGLDSVVVMFLAFAAPDSALLLWAVGCVLAQAISTAQPWVRAYNAGLSTLAGGAAVTVVEVVPGALERGPLGLVAAGSGAVAYFAVDFLLSVVAIPLLGRGSLRGSLFDDALPIAVACTGGVAAMAYLAAVVLHYESSAFPLALVPVAALVYASQGFSRVDDERHRVRALFAAAAGLHGAQDHDELTRVIAVQGETALDARVRLVDEPAAPSPGAGLIATIAITPPRWLVADPRASTTPWVPADQRALDGLAALAGDCLRRLSLMAELEHLASHDPLTGLPNRTAMHQEIRARAAEEPPAVLFCDLDGFKDVNDRHGHEAGDALLRVVAARLQGCVRPHDVVARLGGDEFAVLLPGTSAAEAQQVADRIVAAIAEPVALPPGTVLIAVSIGIAAPEDRVPAEELLHQADVAMYVAKGSDRGRAVLCTPVMRDDRLARTRLGDDLEGAAGRGELLVHYQPVVELADGAIAGFEALVRWRHPVHGLLAPAAFIPAAEASGLVDEVGEFVLRQVLADAPALRRAAGRKILVSVNVPADSLVRGAVVHLVPPGGVEGFILVLEITETTLAEPRVIPVLADLRARDVLIAVDDFGAGHSLAALRQLPVDIIKLDRAFIADMAHDPRAAQIVAVVAQMATVLDTFLVVEGVEEAEQRDQLMALGVGLAQGFYLGAPMPLVAAEALLVARRPARYRV